METRTRFAPSPTGFLHIGGLRTALYSYAFAKSQNGKFILRIEDTDKRRFVAGATEKIYEILKVFGLNWDEGPLVDGPYGPYIQSERAKTGLYQKYAEKLIKDDHAYYCFCHQKKRSKLKDPCRNLSLEQTKARIKKGEPAGIRLKVPDKEKICFFDFVLKKKICWETENIDEVILLKSDGFPTYHLGVVVDDALMKISHIIRGRDWLPSTPVHLLLFRYLDLPLPQIGHLTDILDPAGGKLSKRKGSVSCEDFLAEGYLPEAILNFIMLLGWAPKDNQEIFSLNDFVKEFPKGNLQIANPVFNRRKLDWFNGYYIRQKSNEVLVQLIKPFAPKGMNDSLIKQTIPLVKERLVKLSDYSLLVGFLIEEPKITQKLPKDQIKKALVELEKISDWQTAVLEKALRNLAQKESYHLGKFLMSIRMAITGKKITPPLFESMALLGRAKTIKRLAKTCSGF